MLLCLTICLSWVCVGCHSPSSGVPVKAAKVRVSPVASQCGAVSNKFFPVVFQCKQKLSKFLQWHSSVGQFQLSFSSGAPVYPESIH